MAASYLWSPSSPSDFTAPPGRSTCCSSLNRSARISLCVSTPNSSRTSPDTKLSVLQNDQDGRVQLSHGWRITASEFCSMDSQQWTLPSKQLPSALWKRSNVFGTSPYSKALPYLFRAQVLGHTRFKSSNRQHRMRDQVWLGYWVGPEEVDGWGFVEAFLEPS